MNNCYKIPRFAMGELARYWTYIALQVTVVLCPQTSAQQALTGTINSSMQAVQAAQASLDDFDTLPPLGTDAVRLSSLWLGQSGFVLLVIQYKCWAIHSTLLWPEDSFFKASQAWRKNKMDESKHEIHSQVDAITAGTASMVNLTAGTNTAAFTRLFKHAEPCRANCSVMLTLNYWN